VTPIIVKNENDQFITKLEEIIRILKYDKYKIQSPQLTTRESK